LRLWRTLENEEYALGLQNLLFDEGIESEVRNGIEIWIYDEDERAKAEGTYIRFKQKPSSAHAQRFKKPPVKQKFHVFEHSMPQATYLLITISVGATFLLPAHLQSYLYFASNPITGLFEIQSGQVWRLVTPVFLHGGLLHIAFNMMWLYQLGAQIERNEGALFFVSQLVIVAMICNVSQFMVSGPFFVGMSGVIYAQLGFCWLMRRRNWDYQVGNDLVIFMIVWMVICMLGIIPNVANTQHFVGFVVGTLWGAVQSGYIKQLLRKR
jgi:GlpG protein